MMYVYKTTLTVLDPDHRETAVDVTPPCNELPWERVSDSTDAVRAFPRMVTVTTTWRCTKWAVDTLTMRHLIRELSAALHSELVRLHHGVPLHDLPRLLENVESIRELAEEKQ